METTYRRQINGFDHLALVVLDEEIGVASVDEGYFHVHIRVCMTGL